MKLHHVFVCCVATALLLWAVIPQASATGETYGATGSEYQEVVTIHTLAVPTSGGDDIASTAAPVLIYARQNIEIDKAVLLPEVGSAGADAGTIVIVVAKYFDDGGIAGAVFSETIDVNTTAHLPIPLGINPASGADGGICPDGGTLCAAYKLANGLRSDAGPCPDGGATCDAYKLKAGQTLRWYLTQGAGADLDNAGGAVHLQVDHHLLPLNAIIQ